MYVDLYRLDKILFYTNTAIIVASVRDINIYRNVSNVPSKTEREIERVLKGRLRKRKFLRVLRFFLTF